MLLCGRFRGRAWEITYLNVARRKRAPPKPTGARLASFGAVCPCSTTAAISVVPAAFTHSRTLSPPSRHAPPSSPAKMCALECPKIVPKCKLVRTTREPRGDERSDIQERSTSAAFCFFATPRPPRAPPTPGLHKNLCITSVQAATCRRRYTKARIVYGVEGQTVRLEKNRIVDSPCPKRATTTDFCVLFDAFSAAIFMKLLINLGRAMQSYVNVSYSSPQEPT